MYHITSYGATNVGLERSNNEDAYHIAPDDGLYVVCDGMGGHASGEMASRITVETMVAFVTETIHKPNFRWPFNSPTATTLETRILDCAVRLSNRDVFAAAQADSRHRGMGTTVVAILAGEEQLGVVHVGDSRIYRLRDGKLEQVTEDHSLLNHYRRTRPMTKDEIKNFKGKNVIVRAVGLRESVQPEVGVLDYRPGDRYMLCTDGLTDLVEDEDIEAEMVAAGSDHEKAVNGLIARALAAGGKDNVSVVVLQVDVATDEDMDDAHGAGEDTSPGFDADSQDGYWDQETMPAFEIGDLPRPEPGDPSEVPALDDDPGPFLDDATPVEGVRVPAVQAALAAAARRDDIPPPPQGRANLPEAVADTARGDIPPPPPGRAQLPQTSATDDTPPEGVAAASVEPVVALTRPANRVEGDLARTTPLSTPGRGTRPPTPESPFAVKSQESQAAKDALGEYEDLARAPTEQNPVPAVRSANRAHGERDSGLGEDTPAQGQPAVVVHVNGAVPGDIGGDALSPASAAVESRRAARAHAQTARYAPVTHGLQTGDPTPVAVPVARVPSPTEAPDSQGGPGSDD